MMVAEGLPHCLARTLEVRKKVEDVLFLPEKSSLVGIFLNPDLYDSTRSAECQGNLSHCS